MSVRTLKRRLANFKLSRKNNEIDEEKIKIVMRNEVEGSGSQAGYRKMWHLLRIKHNIVVPRNLVAEYLKEMDPEASSLRKKKK